jgi:hypothetical protein
VLRRLRGVGVTLSEVLRQYHARGVVPLRRRPLRLYETTTDRAPWTRTMTAPTLPSPLEVQRRVVQAIGRSTYSWPPAWLLPMLPHKGTEKFMSHRLLDKLQLFCVLRCDVGLLGVLLFSVDPSVFLLLQLKCAHLVPAKAPLPEEAIFNRNKAAAEKQRAARKAQHKNARSPNAIGMTTTLRSGRRGARRLLQRRSITRVVMERRRGQRSGGLE